MALKLCTPPADEPLLVLFTSTNFKEYFCLAALIAALLSSSLMVCAPVSSLPDSSCWSICLHIKELPELMLSNVLHLSVSFALPLV